MNSPDRKTLLARVAAKHTATSGAGAKNKRAAKNAPKPSIYARLAKLYADMEAAYNACAEAAGLSCRGCETNCCTSFFRHHTYVEWAYLWRGLFRLSEERRKVFIKRAEEYLYEARQSLALDIQPTAMCPLNEDGLCVLYAHRLMICRMHGTRNLLRLPDGGQQIFPGCGRFTALPCAQSAPLPQAAGLSSSCPTLDRTPFYQELAALELELHQKTPRPLPRVNLTLAEMIVLGPPKL